MKNDDARELGRLGESLAARHLQSLGFRILARNERIGHAEIDIVAQDEAGVAFVEVKTRSSLEFGEPYQAVDRDKRERILAAAPAFLERVGMPDEDYRVGVVSVYLPRPDGPATIEWIDEA